MPAAPRSQTSAPGWRVSLLKVQHVAPGRCVGDGLPGRARPPTALSPEPVSLNAPNAARRKGRWPARQADDTSVPAVFRRAPPSRKPDPGPGEVASLSPTVSSQRSLPPAPVTTPAENGTEAYGQGRASRFSNSGALICSSDCSSDQG